MFDEKWERLKPHAPGTGWRLGPLKVSSEFCTAGSMAVAGCSK